MIDPSTVGLPCDVLKNAGNPCVSAHSTIRVIVSGYTGPLYELCKGSVAGPKSCAAGTAQDIGSIDGYADAATHESFCGTSICTITKVYDQSGQGNDLEPAPAGQAKKTKDNPVNAMGLNTSADGHSVYGMLFGKIGMGYRTGCNACTQTTSNGMPTGDEPQTAYMVTSQKDVGGACCFDYGNAETTSNDDGKGTMEAVYFGGGVIWGTGSDGDSRNLPWAMADLEDGIYAGWENSSWASISTNKPLLFDFVSDIIVGDTADKNGGKGRFAIYGGDATSGPLTTEWDGIRPTGYVPMQKQGSLILGTGGDNSANATGRFYEGAVATGAISQATADALQASIVKAKYGQ